MKIQKIPVEQLLPAKYNPRKDLKPGDPEFEKLRRSVEEFGYVEPVIWNQRTGVVVGGHQRLKVLQHLGYTEVECVVVDLDEQKEKAKRLPLWTTIPSSAKYMSFVAYRLCLTLS